MTMQVNGIAQTSPINPKSFPHTEIERSIRTGGKFISVPTILGMMNMSSTI